MASTLSIRAAIPADLPKIDALLGRAYPALLKTAYPPSVMVTAIPLIAKAQPRLLASGTYFVVEDGARVVGAGGWSRSGHVNDGGRGGAQGQIRHFVTDHRRTREGIGTALMSQVFATAKRAGIRHLDCYSTLMAVPFYAACGFAESGSMSVSLAPGIDFPAVRMHRQLS